MQMSSGTKTIPAHFFHLLRTPFPYSGGVARRACQTFPRLHLRPWRRRCCRPSPRPRRPPRWTVCPPPRLLPPFATSRAAPQTEVFFDAPGICAECASPGSRRPPPPLSQSPRLRPCRRMPRPTARSHRSRPPSVLRSPQRPPRSRSRRCALYGGPKGGEAHILLVVCSFPPLPKGSS